MDPKRKISSGLVALLAVVLFAGCGMVQKDSGGDQTGPGDGLLATAQNVGLENCYTCHTTKFHAWMVSRHANFDLEDGTRVDYTELSPGDETYFEITGDPDPHLNPDGTDRCAPCHTGLDYGGNLLDANYYGDVFPDPNIGQMARPIISCEACHGGGSFHYGTGGLPYSTPGFEPCATLCHDLNFEKETYGAHHFAHSNRDWANASGDSVRDADSDVTPILSQEVIIPATTTDPAVVMEVWTLPDPADTVWNGNYAGPYYPVPHEVIKDTHFNAAWAVTGDRLTIYSVSTARLGYVNTANNSPNSGLVNAEDPESCTASCHKAHDFDLAINEQWAHGAHHPVPEGLVDENNFPPGPTAWHAVDHEGFGAGCVRCHNSLGFVAAEGASVEVDLGDLNGKSDGFITCNACHDGENYPTGADLRLRLEGDVALFNNNGSVITTVDAGSSAACVYCHQGREDASRVDGTRFRNMHYLASAAVQYAEKGYEYEGNTYAEPMPDHVEDAGNCVGCHMDDVGSEDLGGHTFHVSVQTCAVGGCHGNGVGSFDDIGISGDPDGDGNATESARDEVQGLIDLLLEAIEDADLNPADGTADMYHAENYPYFFLNDGQDWSLPTAAAAYNWQFIYKDPGAWAHNPYYAIQLLTDSYEDLTGSTP